MKYQKPEIAVMETAAQIVQGNQKHGGLQDVMPSTPAYEADE